jgi:Cys-tRNA(Pro)/Cys-tRNA(Cys) deacylase
MIIGKADYPDLTSIQDLLNGGFEFTVFVHANAVNSLDQAAKERNQDPDQVVRSLIFRLASESFAMVLVAGPKQIPWKSLRSYFNQRRLTQASPEEVLMVSGYKIGTVSPFGLASEIPQFIDESVFQSNQISMGSGKSGTALIMESTEFMRALPAAKTVALFGN